MALVEQFLDTTDADGSPATRCPSRRRGARRSSRAPPWHYVGDFLVLEYWADPDAVAAVLPPGLEPNPDDPGRAAALFVDWQSCSDGGRRAARPGPQPVQRVLHRRQRAARRRGGHHLPVHLGRSRLRARPRLDPGLPEEARLRLDDADLRRSTASPTPALRRRRRLRRHARRERPAARRGHRHARARLEQAARPTTIRRSSTRATSRGSTPAATTTRRARARARDAAATARSPRSGRARRRSSSSGARRGARRAGARADGQGLPLHLRLHRRRPGDGARSCERRDRRQSRRRRRRLRLDRPLRRRRAGLRAPSASTTSRRSTSAGSARSRARRQATSTSRVRAAHDAFPAWAALGPAGRAPYLHRLADLIDANVDRLAAVECEDMAMLLRSLRARVIPRGARNYRAYADLAVAYEERDWHSNGTWNRVMRMPSGPAAVITPWNAPFMLSTWKTAPGLAAGCTVVLKPAEWSPLACSLLGDLVAEAGFPPGVFNIVQGIGEEAGAALVSHPLIRRVSFTGSPETGRLIGVAAAAEPRAVHRGARRQGPADRLRRLRPRCGGEQGRRAIRRLGPGLPGRNPAAGRGAIARESSSKRSTAASTSTSSETLVTIAPRSRRSSTPTTSRASSTSSSGRVRPATGSSAAASAPRSGASGTSRRSSSRGRTTRRSSSARCSARC